MFFVVLLASPITCIIIAPVFSSPLPSINHPARSIHLTRVCIRPLPRAVPALVRSYLFAPCVTCFPPRPSSTTSPYLTLPFLPITYLLSTLAIPSCHHQQQHLPHHHTPSAATHISDFSSRTRYLANPTNSTGREEIPSPR